MYSNTNAGIPVSPNNTQHYLQDPTRSVVTVCPDVQTIPDVETVADIAADPDTVPTQPRLQELPDVLDFCKRHNFPADLVGRWVWIRFPEKPDTETRDLLKAAGFRWVKVRGQWAHNCGYHCRKGKGNPRWKYGCLPVSEISRDEIASLKGVA